LPIATTDHTGRTDLRWAWRGILPGLAGAAFAILMVAGAVILLLGDGYRAAAPWAVDDATTLWVPAAADGFPYRHPAQVRPNRLYDWRLAPPHRIQIYSNFWVDLEKPEGMTLLLPSVEGDPSLFVNGVPTAFSASSERYLIRPSARSVRSDIPAAFLRPGQNRIDVIVVEPGRRGLQAPLILGPLDTPAPLQEGVDRMTGGFRTALLGLSVAAAILALFAGIASKSATPWVGLAAAAAAIGVRALAARGDFQVRLDPFAALIDLIALAAVLVCLGCALVDPRVPRSSPGRRIVGAGVAAFVGLIALSAWGAYQGRGAWEAAGLVLPFLGLSLLVWAVREKLEAGPWPSGWAQGRDGCVLSMLALTTTSAVGVGSGLFWGFWLPGLEVAYGLGVAALLSLLAIVSAATATQGLWRWARDRPRLSRIIRNQQEEIEATARALQQQVKWSAVLEERQRLSRDMHDGIGGQLMSLLARVRSRRISPDQLEYELTDGLSELRLMVDSLDASDGSVADALAVLRSRIRTQTEAAGLSLEWAQTGDLNVVAEDPRWILNLNRLIQEAATNAVRHSRGDRVSVGIEATGDRRLIVTIEDNGIGFDRGSVVAGRGLSNLTFRAVQLGGRLEIGRTGPEGGATVRAVIPIVQTSAPPQDQSRDDMIPS